MLGRNVPSVIRLACMVSNGFENKPYDCFSPGKTKLSELFLSPQKGRRNAQRLVCPKRKLHEELGIKLESRVFLVNGESSVKSATLASFAIAARVNSYAQLVQVVGDYTLV